MELKEYMYTFLLQDTELLDGRQHCYILQTGQGDNHYMSVDSRQELLKIEKAWYRANYLAVKYLGVSRNIHTLSLEKTPLYDNDNIR